MQSVLQGVDIPKHEDPVVDRAHFSIAVGHLVRTWREHQHERTFLGWLQRIAEIDEEQNYNYRTGYYRKDVEMSYLYRFFVHVPHLARPQPIDAITIEPCDWRGDGLDLDARLTHSSSCACASIWWRGRCRRCEIPRGGYIGP